MVPVWLVVLLLVVFPEPVVGVVLVVFVEFVLADEVTELPLKGIAETDSVVVAVAAVVDAV